MLDGNWFSEQNRGYATSFAIREKVHEEQTPYQKIEVYETTEFGYLLCLDGIVMLSTRDNHIYHEMMTHPALFSHPAPRQVLIVGGGDCGSLREILKHPEVEDVVQVELDAQVTRVAERYFPELCVSNGDLRTTLLFQDAIDWLRNAAAQSRDVIILDTTDPIGQAERLFCAPFYRDCHRVLRDGGMVVAQSESPLLDMDILLSLRAEMGKAGFAHVRTLFFPLPSYPSGWWSATIARRGEPFPQSQEIPLRGWEFPTRYYNAEVHRACEAVPESVAQAFAMGAFQAHV